MTEDRFLKRLRKRARKGLRGWPIATITFYGPNRSQATKVVVGIMPSENAEVKELRDWKADRGDVRADPAIAREILEYMENHRVPSVAMTDAIAGMHRKLRGDGFVPPLTLTMKSTRSLHVSSRIGVFEAEIPRSLEMTYFSADCTLWRFAEQLLEVICRRTREMSCSVPRKPNANPLSRTTKRRLNADPACRTSGAAISNFRQSRPERNKSFRAPSIEHLG